MTVISTRAMTMARPSPSNLPTSSKLPSKRRTTRSKRTGATFTPSTTCSTAPGAPAPPRPGGADLEARLGRDLPFEVFLAARSPGIPVLGSLMNTMVGFLIYLGVVYLLGRLLGGKGHLGELAYDIALFWMPIAIAGALINLFSIGWFSCLTAPLAIGVTGLGFYLTYLSVQAGMNLPPRRALVVVIIPALVPLLLFCLVIAIFIALAGLEVSAFAPGAALPWL
ncbi:MAG: YIP1 family protein [Chloroflexaceae bacterium]